MSAPLPSSREAMHEAVMRAKGDHWEAARVWLDIARELRLGETARPLPRPLDADRLTAIPDEHELRVGERPASWGVPEERPDETAVIRYVAQDVSALPRCGNCGHTIELYLPDAHGGPEGWHHSITQQAVCPISQPDQQHTFATPVVDARG